MRLLSLMALRNLLRHPWRSLTTIVGVALGIAAILATLSVGDNVQANVRSGLTAVAGSADLLVAPGAAGRAVFEIEEALALVLDTPGVARAHPVLSYRAEPVTDAAGFVPSVVPGVESGFQLLGRPSDHPEDAPVVLERGSLPQAGSGGIALSAGFAAARNLDLGDPLAFATPFGEVSFTVVGILESGVGLGSLDGGRTALLDLSDLQEAVRLGGRASYLEVIADAPLPELRERLEARLGEAYTVTLPALGGDVLWGVVQTIQAGLQVLAATLLALSGFLAYNTFAAGVVERTREYALLRTICLTKGQVQRLALIEALFISLLGILLGLGLGVLLSYGVTQLNALTIGYEFRTLVVPYQHVALASLVGVAVSLLAGFLPARAASRTPPLAAVRLAEEAGEASFRQQALGWGLIALGILVALVPWQGWVALAASAVAMGLLFSGVTLAISSLLKPTVALLVPLLTRLFGPAGKLGAGFTLRSPARNGVAIGAVIVGMSLTIGVGSLVAGINAAIASWVDTTIVGDLFVNAAVAFPEGFEDEVLARVPGVAVVSGVAVRIVRFEPPGADRGRSVVLVLAEPERFHPLTGFGSFQYVQGQGDNRLGYEALLAGGQLLAANTIMERFGVERDGVVRLRTQKGFTDFRVAGVIVDFTGGGEAFVGSLDDLPRFGGGRPDLFIMQLRPGVTGAQVQQELLEAFPELYLDITLNETYRARILEVTGASFASTNGLLVLAVMIAMLGVANTLGMNLSTRQHEIAVLRSLGLSRAGIRKLVLAEGVVIVILGTLLGVAVGLLLSLVVTSAANVLTGYRVTPSYPWRLIVLAILSSPVLGLLASYLPARRAAQLKPVAALQRQE